jgi:hypothetical protein
VLADVVQVISFELLTSFQPLKVNRPEPQLAEFLSPASQVELWTGVTITWPRRVAIVGYGVKGVGKGGKVGWFVFHDFPLVTGCGKTLNGRDVCDRLSGQHRRENPQAVWPGVCLGASSPAVVV